jgi:hypothetical protein
MTERKEKFNESVRAIRWRMKHEEFRWRDEIRTIPRGVWTFAVAALVIGQVVAQIVYRYTDHGDLPLIAVIGIAAAMASVFDLFLLFFAYINRDAKRRGMNSTLWTLLAIFVPYLIGVVIYFLMREPLPYNCPQCGATVSARFNFCPGCKYSLSPACPDCKRPITPGDKFCAYCARELA